MNKKSHKKDQNGIDLKEKKKKKSNTYKLWGKKFSIPILYPARMSINNENRIKIISNMQEVKKVIFYMSYLRKATEK